MKLRIAIAAIFVAAIVGIGLIWLRSSSSRNRTADPADTRIPSHAWIATLGIDDVTLPPGGDPTGIAVDSRGGKIYWTEFASGRIRRAKLDGTAGEIIADGIAGPCGIAVNPTEDLVYWTTDGPYPRQVQQARLDGSAISTLIDGPAVNRPAAITVAADGDLYWSESVAGRIRRRHQQDVVDVLSSGISSTSDRAGNEVTWVQGIALDTKAGKLYWSEFTSGTIRRGNLDGSGEEVIVAPGVDCDAPAGIALDARGRIYWADRGCGAILRANLDGSGAETIVSADRGGIEPRGIAVDTVAARLYWTDSVDERIMTADLDGGDMKKLVATNEAGKSTGARDDCSVAIESAARSYALRKVHALSICLDKVGAVKAVKRGEADAAKVAAGCVSRLHRFARGGAADEELQAALSPCAKSPPPVDLIPEACAHVTDGGTIVPWTECTRVALTEIAWNTVAQRNPRALEWINEVRPFVEASAGPAVVPARVKATLEVLDDAYGAIRDRSATSVTAAASGLPATGQNTTYDAAGQSVPDDGALRVGVPMRFRDNHDGTISDLTTGLMWEKKCDCPDDKHDFRLRLPWTGDGTAPTIWDWLASINGEGFLGFAGHSDWRVPNAKELVSIVDYERFNPAVAEAFDGPLCGLACTDVRDPACSCTLMRAYWSSTTFADDPTEALAIGFHLGLVGDAAKTAANAVRAVRGAGLNSSESAQ